jgi:hypothetical protein
MSYFTFNINSIDAYIIYTHVNVFLFSFFFFYSGFGGQMWRRILPQGRKHSQRHPPWWEKVSQVCVYNKYIRCIYSYFPC